MEEIKTAILCDGVRFHTITDERFKSNRITMTLLTRLSEDYVSENALLFGLLKDRTRLTPSRTELVRKFAALYGAGLSDAVSTFGSCQLLSLGSGGMADRYALNGEPLSEEIAKLMSEVVFDPYFEEDGGFSREYTAIEKDTLMDDIRSVIDNKRSYALGRTNRLAARGKSFGIPRLGTLDTAEKITPETVRAAYDRLFGTAQIEIMCIGNGDFEAVKKTFAEALAGVKRNYVPFAKYEILPRTAEVQRVSEEMAIAQAKMVMAYSLDIRETDPLIPAVRLMNAMLGGTVTSKLFTHVREEKSLCYYCTARYDRLKSMLTIDSGVQQQNMDIAYEAILEQVEAMKKGDFTDEEMEQSRLAMITSYRAVGDSAYSVENWYLGQLLSERMCTPEQEVENLMAVTREQVIEAASRMQLDTVYRLECRPGEAAAVPEGEEEEEE